MKLVGGEEGHVDHINHDVGEGGVGVGGMRCGNVMKVVLLRGVTYCARGLDLHLALTSFLPAASSWMWFLGV